MARPQGARPCGRCLESGQSAEKSRRTGLSSNPRCLSIWPRIKPPCSQGGFLLLKPPFNSLICEQTPYAIAPCPCQTRRAAVRTGLRCAGRKAAPNTQDCEPISRASPDRNTSGTGSLRSRTGQRAGPCRGACRHVCKPHQNTPRKPFGPENSARTRRASANAIVCASTCTSTRFNPNPAARRHQGQEDQTQRGDQTVCA